MVLLLCLSFAGLFSNSFVVEEAAVTHFLASTAVLLFLLTLRRRASSADPGLAATVLFLCLALLGVLRVASVYFRCREEQSGYCAPTDFHKPIGTLPRDGDEAYEVFNFSIENPSHRKAFDIFHVVAKCGLSS